MNNRVIALIDFSVYSHALAELAVRWCQISQAKLVFVHQVTAVFPALADDIIKQKVVRNEKERSLERLKEFVSKKNLTDMDISYVVSDSHLLNILEELVQESFEDIILVGIRGTSRLKRLLIGNTTTTIINGINRTIVAVPEKLCAGPNAACNLVPKRLVVSLNTRFPLNKSAFDTFLQQYNTVISKLEFISAIADEKEEDVVDYLGGLAGQYSTKFTTSHQIFKGENHFKQIKSHVKSEEDTVLVVQKGSRNLTDHLFRKFVINEVVDSGALPLVVLPNTSG